MLKINYSYLCVFTALFFNSSNVLHCSLRPSNSPLNNASIPSYMSSNSSISSSLNKNENFNHVLNNSMPLLVPDDSNASDTTNAVRIDKSKPSSVAPHIQKQEIADTNEDKVNNTPDKPNTLSKLSTQSARVQLNDANKKTPYECHICFKSFSEKNGLKNHMKKHENEKPFKCDICNKRFLTNSEKKMHLRTHRGEKLFKCDICQKRLSSYDALENHLKSHKEKKQYKCIQCATTFFTKHELKCHINLHRKIRPYTCYYCGATFAEKIRCENHMRETEAENEALE